MKYFLLIAGYHYYPEAGTNDWKGTYKTREAAEAQVRNLNQPSYIKFGRYIVNDEEYDWYEIIDLREWIFGGIDEEQIERLNREDSEEEE